MSRVVKLIRLLPVLVVAGLISSTSMGAEQRFKPPEIPGHVPIEISQWKPRDPLLEYLDVYVMAVALGLSVFLSYKYRTRTGLQILSLFSLGYFGFYKMGCVCPIGSIQNVSLAIFDSGYVVPVFVAAIFLLPLAFALFFGRVYCGGVCPHGALQDLVLIRAFKLPGWLTTGLGLLAVVYLGLSILLSVTGGPFLICDYDPFVPIFRLSGSSGMVTLGACFVLISLFIGRPYCRFLCPYGVLLGWMSRLSQSRIRITSDVCIPCNLCEESCPFDAITRPNVELPIPRHQGKRVLASMIVLLPILITLGAIGGHALGPVLARMHPQVQLAEEIQQVEAKKVQLAKQIQQKEAKMVQLAKQIQQEKAEMVQLAKQIQLEKSKLASLSKDESDRAKAYRQKGEGLKPLYKEAQKIRGQFDLGGSIFGALLGLVIGGKLIRFSVRRTRTEFETDKSGCYACGRCYGYCPVHLNPLVEIQEIRDAP